MQVGDAIWNFKIQKEPSNTNFYSAIMSSNKKKKPPESVGIMPQALSPPFISEYHSHAWVDKSYFHKGQLQ